MAVITLQEITYDFGKVAEGVVFDKLVNINKEGAAIVVVLGQATLILPPDTYEVIDG